MATFLPSVYAFFAAAAAGCLLATVFGELRRVGTDRLTAVTLSALVATLAAAATADDDTFYLLPEPNVTSALLQNSALKNVLDLSKTFETASGVSLAMGCIVAKKDFVQQNKAAIDAFLAEYQKSVEYTSTNLDDTATLCETYGIIPKAAVAKQAIPRCSIAFVTGSEMKTVATENLNVLLAASAQSVGGKLPGDGVLCYGSNGSDHLKASLFSNILQFNQCVFISPITIYTDEYRFRAISTDFSHSLYGSGRYPTAIGWYSNDSGIFLCQRNIIKCIICQVYK